MTTLIKCRFSPNNQNTPFPDKVIYRLSYFFSPEDNSLLRQRPKYSESKVNEKDGSFEIEIDSAINTSKGYNINIYFSTETTYWKTQQRSSAVAYWCIIDDPSKDLCTVYEQGSTPNKDKVSIGKVYYSNEDLPPQNKNYNKLIEAQIKRAQDEIERKVINTYEALEEERGFIVENNSYFHYVNDTRARLPIIFFPIMSLFTSWSNTSNAIVFYSNLLDVAKFNCGVPKYALFQDLLDNQQYKLCSCIIQEMFTMTVRCLQYKEDTSSTKEEIDRWSVIDLFPHMSRSFFDCEDGSRHVMDLFCALMKLHAEMIKLNIHSELMYVCGFLQNYTPFFCIGDLRVKTVAIHVYCILLDTKYVESVEGKHGFVPLQTSKVVEYMPSIHLESTHHSLGLWDEQYEVNTKELEMYHQMNSDLSKYSGRFGVPRHLVKLRAPLKSRMEKTVYNDPLYKNARALISPMFKGKAVQFLVTQYKDNKQISYGSIEDLMNNSKTICLETLIELNIDTDIEDKYSELLSILPCGSVPDKPANPEQNEFDTKIKYRNVAANIEIQQVFYQEKKKEYDELIQSLVKNSDRRMEIVKATMKVTADINISQFWLIYAERSTKDDKEEKSSPNEQKKTKKMKKTKKKKELNEDDQQEEDYLDDLMNQLKSLN